MNSHENVARIERRIMSFLAAAGAGAFAGDDNDPAALAAALTGAVSGLPRFYGYHQLMVDLEILQTVQALRAARSTGPSEADENTISGDVPTQSSAAMGADASAGAYSGLGALLAGAGIGTGAGFGRRAGAKAGAKAGARAYGAKVGAGAGILEVAYQNVDLGPIKDEPQGPAPEPPKPRNLLTACAACRTSKVKCEGGIPCTRCIKQGRTESCERCSPRSRGRRKNAEAWLWGLGDAAASAGYSQEEDQFVSAEQNGANALLQAAGSIVHKENDVSTSLEAAGGIVNRERDMSDSEQLLEAADSFAEAGSSSQPQPAASSETKAGSSSSNAGVQLQTLPDEDDDSFDFLPPPPSLPRDGDAEACKRYTVAHSSWIQQLRQRLAVIERKRREYERRETVLRSMLIQQEDQLELAKSQLPQTEEFQMPQTQSLLNQQEERQLDLAIAQLQKEVGSVQMPAAPSLLGQQDEAQFDPAKPQLPNKVGPQIRPAETKKRKSTHLHSASEMPPTNLPKISSAQQGITPTSNNSVASGSGERNGGL